MKNLLSILFLLMSVFMYGQKVPMMKKEVSGKEYKINLYEACKNKLSEIPISQFAEDVEFIPLETTDDCLIGDACIVSSITQKDIFIFDYERCYHFDRDGKFLNTIGAKGNGPGEYTKPMKCIVDTLNQWVYFPDHWTGRLLNPSLIAKKNF